MRNCDKIHVNTILISYTGIKSKGKKLRILSVLESIHMFRKFVRVAFKLGIPNLLFFFNFMTVLLNSALCPRKISDWKDNWLSKREETAHGYSIGYWHDGMSECRTFVESTHGNLRCSSEHPGSARAA